MKAAKIDYIQPYETTDLSLMQDSHANYSRFTLYHDAAGVMLFSDQTYVAKNWGKLPYHGFKANAPELVDTVQLWFSK